jgi:hypothetical protein
MNQLETIITSDSFKFCIHIMDIFIGLSILAFTSWISVQWINTWFVRHFGESFILSRVSSEDLYVSLFSRILRNKDPNMDPCYICLDHVDNYIILPCSHRVHANCLKIWMDLSDRCPMCRRNIN